MTDEELVELFWSRSELAIAETEKKYGALCGGIAQGILESRQDAEECVNDSMLRLWNSIPPARPRSMMAYLGTIGRNRALELYRKRRTKKRGEGCGTAVLDELSQCLGGREEPLADSVVIRDVLNSFLGELNEEQRAVFLRRYWACQSVAEIAKAIGAGGGRVESMLHRLRERLRERLRKEGIEV